VITFYSHEASQENLEDKWTLERKKADMYREFGLVNSVTHTI
jgi:hypothetical protein